MFENYQLIRSDRKTLSIEVREDLTVIVRAPRRMAGKSIDSFVRSKSEWIEAHLNKMKRMVAQSPPPLTKKELAELIRAARTELASKAERYAAVVGVDFGRVTIRSQKTRWGSCSAKGNLNFNCLLMQCPEEVRDYVVVHELCHRIHLNHSAAFWQEVERVLPDYKGRRKWLKENGGRIMLQLPK